MKIRRLVLDKFMSTDALELAFPERGVLLVTGPNGAGKSTLVEAVSYGLWGSPLRDIPHPWREGVEGAVVVETPLAHVARRTTKSAKRSMVWSVPGVDPAVFESPTKGHEALLKLVGPWDVWSRSHVFSSADAAHFTLATDRERKLLLETILGLDRFDPALETCRSELRAAARTMAELQGQVREMTARRESETILLEETRAALAEVPEPPAVDADVKAQLAELARLMAGARAEIGKLRKDAAIQARSGGAVDEQVRALRARLAQLRDRICPMCSQEIPTALRDKLAADMSEVEKLHAKAVADRAEASSGLEEEIAGIEEEIDALSRRHTAVGTDAMLADQRRQQRAHLAGLVAKAERGLRELEGRLGRVQEALDRAVVAARRLGLAEGVLGLRGVRAHVLGQTLAGIEAVANSWLVRIAGPGFRLNLRPYEEKKSGGVKDSIALSVDGAGGGHGYGGASGGERRRIDVALLLAIAEVASAASGKTGGTLFLDEVFDAIDSDGVAAVSRAVEELARDRCVVLITHNELLVEHVTPALHLRLPLQRGVVAK